LTVFTRLFPHLYARVADSSEKVRLLALGLMESFCASLDLALYQFDGLSLCSHWLAICIQRLGIPTTASPHALFPSASALAAPETSEEAQGLLAEVLLHLAAGDAVDALDGMSAVLPVLLRSSCPSLARLGCAIVVAIADNTSHSTHTPAPAPPLALAAPPRSLWAALASGWPSSAFVAAAGPLCAGLAPLLAHAHAKTRYAHTHTHTHTHTSLYTHLIALTLPSLSPTAPPPS
jgi:hypothetical protein